MKKRIIAALLVGAMATGLVACGNSSESSSKEQKTEQIHLYRTSLPVKIL